MHARAFTVGQDLFFREGAFDPGTDSGKRLLAHELTHVAQQRSGAARGAVIHRQAAPEDEAQRKAEEARELAEVYASSASDIEGDWPKKKSLFQRVARDPNNKLTGRQLLFIWHGVWGDIQNRANNDLNKLDDRLFAANSAAHAENITRFRMGARDALGPEYRKLADERDTAMALLSVQDKIASWLEDTVGAMKQHKTVEDVTRQAEALVKSFHFFQLFIEPLILLGIGGFSGSRPGLPSRPRPPAGAGVPDTASPPPSEEPPGTAPASAPTPPKTAEAPAAPKTPEAPTKPPEKAAPAEKPAHVPKAGGKLAENDFQLGPNPNGPEAFKKTSAFPGGQAEKAAYFERLARELRQRTGWNAERTGETTDGSIVYHGEAQQKALVITKDGRVLTGTWGEHVKLTVRDGRPALIADWDLPGWKQW
jgi:ketosteroid isomerase-like protein